MKNDSRALKASRAQVAVDDIAKLIFDGSLRPGQQLIETDLARQLNVSRAPIREALRELSREGLVDVVARRGAFVARMDAREVSETYDVRATLEGLAAQLCAEHIGSKPLRELEDLLVQMRDAAAKGDIERYSQATLQFKVVIWENTPNRVLRELLRRMWRRSLKVRLISLRLPGGMEQSLASNERLFDALRRHDAHAAQMLRWLGVQQGKRAVINGYFGEVRPDRRTQLERDLSSLDVAAPPPDVLQPTPRRLRSVNRSERTGVVG